MLLYTYMNTSNILDVSLSINVKFGDLSLMSASLTYLCDGSLVAPSHEGPMC